MEQHFSERLLTMEQAAEALRCTTEALRKRIARGKLPGVRIYRPGERTVYIEKEDLLAFIRNTQQSPGGASVGNGGARGE